MKKSVIIIGSGMAGLFSGALLARAGFQVTVLEKQPAAGGLLASFNYRQTRFDTGVHYLGALAPGQILWRYFQAMELFSLCEFEEMDPDGFEEYRFPGLCFRVPKGIPALQERLIQSFPQEQAGIEQCFQDWRQIARHFPLYNLDQEIRPEIEIDILSDPLARMSLDDYLKQRISDHRLRGLLSANNGLYGLPPEECPVYIHALITDSFLQSAWKIAGPSQNLARALIRRIQEHGGQVRTRARVQHIISEKGIAQAVVLENGERLRADWFISTIHPKAVLRLLDESAVRPIYRQRVTSLGETSSAYGLFVGLKAPGWPMPKRNVFIHHSYDMSKQYHEIWGSGQHVPHTLFISPSESAEGKARTLSVFCAMSWEELAQWENTSPGQRPPEYTVFKQRVAQSLLEQLEIIYPGINQQIETWCAATPLTFRDFTGTWQGSAYGIKKNCQVLRESTLSVRTRLNNLFLAGQSIVLPGIVGVTISAVAASGAILGFPKLFKVLGIK